MVMDNILSNGKHSNTIVFSRIEIFLMIYSIVVKKKRKIFLMYSLRKRDKPKCGKP